jgi:hypothetical protein
MEEASDGVNGFESKREMSATIGVLPHRCTQLLGKQAGVSILIYRTLYVNIKDYRQTGNEVLTAIIFDVCRLSKDLLSRHRGLAIFSTF